MNNKNIVYSKDKEKNYTLLYLLEMNVNNVNEQFTKKYIIRN
jgi:hypothetical protein